MGIPYSIKCPACGENIKSLVEPTPNNDPDTSEINNLMLALHICKDRRSTTRPRPTADIEKIREAFEETNHALLCLINCVRGECSKLKREGYECAHRILADAMLNKHKALLPRKDEDDKTI